MKKKLLTIIVIVIIALIATFTILQVIEKTKKGPTKVEATETDTHKGIVYLDPTDLTKECNAENSVSKTKTKTGCMKWYIYAEDDSTYTMILDHNTTALVAWNSSGKTADGMNEVATALAEDTSSWDSSLNVRLITADEIVTITGNTNFESETSYWGFYLDGASGDDSTWRTPIANSTNKSNYAWLYDYTNGCTSYGCNTEDNNEYVYMETLINTVYGYWTSSTLDIYNVWSVDANGGMFHASASAAASFGVRPVITIPKSIIAKTIKSSSLESKENDTTTSSTISNDTDDNQDDAVELSESYKLVESLMDRIHTLNDLWVGDELYGYFYKKDSYTVDEISNQVKLYLSILSFTDQINEANREDEYFQLNEEDVEKAFKQFFGPTATYQNESLTAPSASNCKFLFNYDDSKKLYTQYLIYCGGVYFNTISTKLISAQKYTDRIEIVEKMVNIVTTIKDDEVIKEVHNTISSDSSSKIFEYTSDDAPDLTDIFESDQLYSYKYTFKYNSESDSYYLYSVEKVK
jgi:hypothetical protein